MSDHPLRTELDAVLRSSPLAARLGIELLDWSPGTARTRLLELRDAANLAGSVHGGVVFALADAAFEAACNSYGRLCVAVETACHYASAAPLGAGLVAVAQEVTRSRRLASYRIDVTDESAGDLRAWYMALCYRTDRWHLGQDAWPAEWRAAH